AFSSSRRRRCERSHPRLELRLELLVPAPLAGLVLGCSRCFVRGAPFGDGGWTALIDVERHDALLLEPPVTLAAGDVDASVAREARPRCGPCGATIVVAEERDEHGAAVQRDNRHAAGPWPDERIDRGRARHGTSV